MSEVARYAPNWAEQMMEPQPHGEYVALEAYERLLLENADLRKKLVGADEAIRFFSRPPGKGCVL